MPVESLPWSIQGQSHPATVARNAQAAMLGAPAAAVSPAVQILTAGGSHGVVSAGDLAVAQNGTPNMSVNVAAGRAFIRGTETASLNQGVYSFFNDGVVNLSIAAADPTNPRRDLIIAQVRDANYSGAANDARLAVVAGTPAASPADPTPPANALVLARVAVAAGATSITNANITDLRTRAASLGGTQICTSSTRPTGVAGLTIFETDTGRLMVRDANGWVILAEPTQTYTPTATNLTVGTGGTLTGTFKRGDGWIDLQIYAVLGSAGFSVTGNPSFSLPSGIQPSTALWLMQGQAILNDANGYRWYGSTYHDSFNSLGVTYSRSQNTANAIPAITVSGVTANDPMTWTTNDYVAAWARFQMSNRHSFT